MNVLGSGYKLALLVCAYLSLNDNGTYHSIDKVVAAVGGPYYYIAKLCFKLSGSGILKGLRGHHGGYRLARPAQAINLYEIMEAIYAVNDRRFRPVSTKCDNNQRLNWAALAEANGLLRSRLQTESLASFCRLSVART